MAQVDTVRTRKNLVADHLAMLIDGDIDEQAVRERKLNVVLLGRPGGRVIEKGDQPREAEDIERHVVGDGAHGDSGNNELQDDGKNENGGEKSAGGRKRQRTENI